MAGGYTLDDVRTQTFKGRDAWWTVFLVDPIAAPLVVGTANRTRFTPNQISFAALLLGLVSALLFWEASTWGLVAGALVYHLAFVLDCMDGKVARLKGTGSILGGWLDYIFDRIRVVTCALALFGGQYRETGEAYYLLLAVLVVFLDALRYMDALQISKVRRSMNHKIQLACIERGIDPAKWLLAPTTEEREESAEIAAATQAANAPDLDADPDPAPAPKLRSATPQMVVKDETQRTVVQSVGRTRAQAEMQKTFSRRFGWYLRMRDFLVRRRVRPHLFSGIEFQMFVFIVGPLTGFVVLTTLASSVLLLVFELAIIFKLVLATRDHARLIDRLTTAPLDSLD